MAAAKTDVFSPFTSNLVEGNNVSERHAAERMPDYREAFLCLEKRVTASAGVFRSFGSALHHMDAMAQEPAGIVNSFLEFVMVGIGVAG